MAVVCTTLVAVVFATVLTVSPAAGQTSLDELVGYEAPENPIPEGTWTDPVVQFGLDPDNLAPTPEFDFATLHASNVFAAGVEVIEVDNDPLQQAEDRHLRVLQAIATIDRDLEAVQAQIAERQPAVDRLISQISRERENELRLSDEIFIREQAIAEFAIRAFIGEDQVDLVLDEPDSEHSEARVLTDQVREDHRLQIAEREAEIARRESRRAGYEADLDVVRQEMDAMRATRTELTEFRERAEDLTEQTADAYQVAMHARLSEFVAGADLPYVALNAYVIAARTLETEDPQCGIHWSMLAGIGFIESYHGYFGDSTLDINGHTTEDIRGLPLDGRILQGAEFVTPGVDVPEATGRTESTALTPPAPAADAPAPEPAAETAPAPAPVPAGEGEAPTDTGEGSNTGEGSGDTTAAAPAPVIKRLALILDSDGGVLDGDTTYDRAVGPMQFIPSTWRLYDADGNGDGENDPQNIYDASLASARYLCAATGTMTTVAGEQQAYFAYNHDLDYSANVTRAGARYRSLLAVETPELTEGDGRYYLGIAEASQVDEDETQALLDELSNLDLPDW